MRRLLLPALLALVPGSLGAQSFSTTIPVNAMIVGNGITITSLADLDFGVVTRGVPATVLPTSANAGRWEVVGTANAFVNISFTLPALLPNTQALPGITMPISFSVTSARWRRGNPGVGAATPFNPNVGTTGRLGPPPRPELYLWLGGTVSPSASQAPGVYVGNIVVTISYL